MFTTTTLSDTDTTTTTDDGTTDGSWLIDQATADPVETLNDRLEAAPVEEPDDDTSDAADSLWDGVTDQVDDATDAVDSTWEGVTDGATDAVDSTWDGVTDQVDGATDAVDSAWGGIGETINSVREALPNGDTLMFWIMVLAGLAGTFLIGMYVIKPIATLLG